MPPQRVPCLLAIDIGGTWLRLALAGSPEQILGRRKLPTPAQEPPAALVRTIARSARAILANVETRAGCPLSMALTVPWRTRARRASSTCVSPRRRLHHLSVVLIPLCPPH